MKYHSQFNHLMTTHPVRTTKDALVFPKGEAMKLVDIGGKREWIAHNGMIIEDRMLRDRLNQYLAIGNDGTGAMGFSEAYRKNIITRLNKEEL